MNAEQTKAVNFENLTPVLSAILVDNQYAVKGSMPKARKKRLVTGGFDARVTFYGFSKDVSMTNEVRTVVASALQKIGISTSDISIVEGSQDGRVPCFRNGCVR